MQHAEFMTAVTDIYGPYASPVLEQITFKYIKERFKESELQAVIEKLILKKSAKFKTPPDPAEFEELFFKQSDAQVEIEAAHFYDMLNNTGCSLDNIIVSDIRAQKALVSAFGSWPDFCQRNPESEQWHRKNFVAAFIKQHHEATDEQPSIMYGDSSQRLIKAPIPFGDKDKCLMLIEQHKAPLQINTDFIRRVK